LVYRKLIFREKIMGFELFILGLILGAAITLLIVARLLSRY